MTSQSNHMTSLKWLGHTSSVNFWVPKNHHKKEVISAILVGDTFTYNCMFDVEMFKLFVMRWSTYLNEFKCREPSCCEEIMYLQRHLGRSPKTELRTTQSRTTWVRILSAISSRCWSFGILFMSFHILCSIRFVQEAPSVQVNNAGWKRPVWTIFVTL